MMPVSRTWVTYVLISIIVVGIGLVVLWHLFHAALNYIVRRESAPCASTLRTVVTAEVEYQSVFPKHGYSRTLDGLGPPSTAGCGTSSPNESAACLIDFAVVHAQNPATPKSGYIYSYTPGPPNAHGVIESFSVRSDPAKNEYGANHFYIDETGILRMEKNHPAGKESPAVDSSCN